MLPPRLFFLLIFARRKVRFYVSQPIKKKIRSFVQCQMFFGGVTNFLPSPGLRGVGPAEEIKIGLKAPQLRLLALTVATEETDGYKRFMKSAKTNNIDVKVKNYS